MNLQRLIFYDYRNIIFIPLIVATTALAIRPDSTLIPLILSLSVLLTFSPFLFRKDRSNYVFYIPLTLVGLSVGSSWSRIHASLEALSTPGASLAALFISTTVLSSISLLALYSGIKFGSNFGSPWAQATLFPAIWATLWCTISYLNPLGNLATWSVSNSEDAYKWLTPYLGPAGKDWIVAAWAVVISQIIGRWYIGAQEEEEEESLLDTPRPASKVDDNFTATALLAAILVLLTIPSFITQPLPLPISLTAVNESTPLSVGCVLPAYGRYNHHSLTLQDFIDESDRIRSNTKVILWPEGAVTFHSTEEKMKAFEAVRNMSQGAYVGVSFEEVMSDPDDPSGRRSFTRTGMALISQDSPEPHLVYYKRHLVPVAESYRLRHSTVPPTIFELQLAGTKLGRNSKRRTWDGTRPIDISASICLDFAQPSPFADLTSKPSLILAPARTWDRTVGYAMWLQAKQRAEELDTMVLWCDGGEGGVSGVAGHGYTQIQQVGPGSFIRTIGIKYPADTRRTMFARVGDLAVLILFWIIALGPELVRRRRQNKTNKRAASTRPANNLLENESLI
ncbi:hypothetical protein D9613_002160 [Agrocybe pediades]|uniref:Apolipoprotein N-acyltransferase n=1 Tax=Agrocybe pediades TaxID=84607 RepID=A0A8H4R677_9AGAR|nr:hypothetical protein D9613_002160 [Agrocybe pediades]